MKKIIAIFILVATMLCIVSCGISDDPKELKKMLKEEDYEVKTITKSSEVKAWVKAADVDADVTAVVTGYNEDGDTVMVIVCEDSKSAKEVAEYLEEYLDEAKEEFEDLDEEELEKLDVDLDDYKVGTSGKVAYLGNKAAIKAIGG